MIRIRKLSLILYLKKITKTDKVKTGDMFTFRSVDNKRKIEILFIQEK